MFVDITGKKFGRLTAIKRAGADKNRNVFWECECECGNKIVVRGNALKSGNTKSCGCLVIERMKENNPTKKKNGKSNSRLHRIWAAMRTRCYNENSDNYDRYGGRGIEVCEEWKDNFVAFYDWAVLNGYEDGLEIDRINNNGNYEPDNCKWSTKVEQANNRRTNTYVEIDGEVHTLSEWARISGISRGTIGKRYHDGKRGKDLIKKIG